MTPRTALSDPIRAIANPIRRDVEGRKGADARGDRDLAAAIAATQPDTCGDPVARHGDDDQSRRTAHSTLRLMPELSTPKTITRTFRGPAMQARLEFVCPNVDVRDYRPQDEAVKLDLGFGDFEVMAEREWIDDRGIAAGGRRSLERTGDVYVTPEQLNEIGRMVLEAAAELI